MGTFKGAYGHDTRVAFLVSSVKVFKHFFLKAFTELFDTNASLENHL